MEPDLIDTRLDAIIRKALDESEEPVLLIDPSEEAVTRLVRVAADRDDDPTTRVLADRRVLKSAMQDFIVASNAADLIEQDRLELRTLDEEPDNSLLVTPSSVVALVETGSAVGGLTTDDDEFIEDAYRTFGETFETVEPFSMRTPPLSRVRETLAADVGHETEADFSAVLSSLETAGGDGDGDGLDEVTVSLLVAAKNEVLLYDISRWGEEVGIASKATFSRTKTSLEDAGIIDTEKVPIDVGRPRLRLKLGDDRLEDADGPQLATVAQSILS
ncbi:hypothetical protein BRD13_02525 [Halobacteriales archaeon SW_5_70_135]|nr:MAG: hypothetical protein BRD13_02525 [Halobacteriales archaeon SW_5_70_135]